jgi:hypothetical protein
MNGYGANRPKFHICRRELRVQAPSQQGKQFPGRCEYLESLPCQGTFLECGGKLPAALQKFALPSGTRPKPSRNYAVLIAFPILPRAAILDSTCCHRMIKNFVTHL